MREVTPAAAPPHPHVTSSCRARRWAPSHQRRTERGERKEGPCLSRAPPTARPAPPPCGRKWFLPRPRRAGPERRLAAVAHAQRLSRSSRAPPARGGPWPRCSAPPGACGRCARASGPCCPCCPRARPAPPSGEAPRGGPRRDRVPGSGGAGPAGACGGLGCAGGVLPPPRAKPGKGPREGARRCRARSCPLTNASVNPAGSCGARAQQAGAARWCRRRLRQLVPQWRREQEHSVTGWEKRWCGESVSAGDQSPHLFLAKSASPAAGLLLREIQECKNIKRTLGRMS